MRAAWEKLDDDDPDKNRWDWAAQHRQIEDSCYGFIKKACGENARLIDTLPDTLLPNGATSNGAAARLGCTRSAGWGAASGV